MLQESTILDCVDKLPRLPTTVTKILEISNNINSSPGDLMQAITFDPILTAKVLKLINSAYFALPQRVSSLKRAVILLGINTIKNLALSTSVMSSISLKKRVPDFNIDKFWEHSLGCGVLCKMLAHKMNIDKKDQEEYFIAGLIHDIGKILLVQYITNEYEKVLKLCRENRTGQLEEEENILGICHPDVGAIITKKWQFPESLIESVKEHHSPLLTGENVKLKCAVHIADVGCNVKGLAINEYEPNYAIGVDIMKYTGFKVEDIEVLLVSLPEQIEKAKVFLSAD